MTNAYIRILSMCIYLEKQTRLRKLYVFLDRKHYLFRDRFHVESAAFNLLNKHCPFLSVNDIV